MHRSLTVFAVLFWTSGAASQPTLPLEGPDASALPLDQAVYLVETYELDRYSAEAVMVRAASSGETSLRPRLRSIAEAYKTVHQGVSFTALHALWELGEPEAYFVDNIRGHSAVPSLAYYSALVAARAPNEATLLVIEEAAIGNDLELDAAEVAYTEVFELEQQYARDTFDGEMINDEMRARGLINILAIAYRFDWPLNSWTAPVDSTDELTYLHPEAIWARTKLRTLAASAPQVVINVAEDLPEDTHFFDEYGSDLPAGAWDQVAPGFAEFVIDEAFPGGPPTGGAVPTCEGVTATVYVSGDGTIIGGELDGQPYAGLLRGTDGNDVMVGTDGPDQIAGLAGDDVLCGLGGDDLLQGNGDADVLYGGPGDDVLAGGNGGDTITGGDGTDEARGGRGNDACDAEAEDSCEREIDE